MVFDRVLSNVSEDSVTHTVSIFGPMACMPLRWLSTDSEETCLCSSERRTLVKSVVNSSFSFLVADMREDSSSSTTGDPEVTGGKADKDSKRSSSDDMGLFGGILKFTSSPGCVHTIDLSIIILMIRRRLGYAPIHT